MINMFLCYFVLNGSVFRWRFMIQVVFACGLVIKVHDSKLKLHLITIINESFSLAVVPLLSNFKKWNL